MRSILVVVMFYLMSGSCFSATTTPAAPQPVVVDSQGKVIGPLLSFDEVVIGVDASNYVSIEFGKSGFAPRDLGYVFTSTDCSGTKYFLMNGLPIPGNLKNDIISYGAFSEATTIMSNSSVDGFGTCRPVMESVFAAPARQFDLTSLHLVPPFKVIAY